MPLRLRPILLVSGLLLILPGIRGADSPAITATLFDAPPPSSVPLPVPLQEPVSAAGWRVHWEKDDGRREVIQHWVSPDNRALHGVALSIRAGSKARLEDSRLHVSLTSAPGNATTVDPGPLAELVFEGDALLPPNSGKSAYKNGRWLVLSWPSIPIEAGRHYALRLGFAAEKSELQELILSVAPLEAGDNAASCGYNEGGAAWKWWRSYKRNGTLVMRLPTGDALLAAAEPGHRTLRVDPRDPECIPSLKEAAGQARPGDTIWLAPGSGPYREECYVARSGASDAPITIEGNHNEITGFEPLVFSRGSDGRPVATISTDYPFVLRHAGQRIPEDAASRVFSNGASYDPASRTLTLPPGVSPEGWEISVRRFAVRMHNVSHQRYRNLVASGSLNDGFNLHGKGEDLIFENITGRDNLDEGFSAHDDIDSEIRGGVFFGNDNGLYNVGRSVTRISGVDVRDNLGVGVCAAQEAIIEAEHLRVWGNGMMQAAIEKSGMLRGSDIVAYHNTRASRPWLTYMESRNWITAPGTINGPLAAVAATSGIALSSEEAPAPTH